MHIASSGVRAVPLAPGDFEMRFVKGLQLLQRHSELSVQYLNGRIGRNAVMHMCDVVCGSIASGIVLAASRSAQTMGTLSLESRAATGSAVAGKGQSQGTASLDSDAVPWTERLRFSAHSSKGTPPLSSSTCRYLGRLCRAGATAAQQAVASGVSQESARESAKSLEDASATLEQRSEGYRRLAALEAMLDKAR